MYGIVGQLFFYSIEMVYSYVKGWLKIEWLITLFQVQLKNIYLG